MATVATRLRNFLLGKDSITKTAKAGQRIFDEQPPQGQPRPYVFFEQSGTENADVLNGSVGDDPLWTGMTVNAVAETPDEARLLAAALKTEMHLYRGTFDDTTAKGIFVDSTSQNSERYDDGSDGAAFIMGLSTRIFL